jgi:hypothetical protein
VHLYLLGQHAATGLHRQPFFSFCFGGCFCWVGFSVSFLAALGSFWFLTRSRYVVRAGLTLAILLPQHLLCWDYRHAPPRLAPAAVVSSYFLSGGPGNYHFIFTDNNLIWIVTNDT